MNGDLPSRFRDSSTRRAMAAKLVAAPGLPRPLGTTLTPTSWRKRSWKWSTVVNYGAAVLVLTLWQ